MNIDRIRDGGVRSWGRRQAQAYSDGHERPLAGYLELMAAYALATLGPAAVAHRRGRLPERLGPWDVVQLGVATHKLSRILAKDPVTSPLRAPFTTYVGLAAPSELEEEVRGHGLQHSVGELITCPMCLAQWVATGFALGLAFAPGPTRLALSTFTAVGAADFLQHLYARLQQVSG
jgi:hypothetical protein